MKANGTGERWVPLFENARLLKATRREIEGGSHADDLNEALMRALKQEGPMALRAELMNVRGLLDGWIEDLTKQ